MTHTLIQTLSRTILSRYSAILLVAISITACDSRLYDPPTTPFFKTAISGALSDGVIIQLDAQPEGTLQASYIDVGEDIVVSQLIMKDDRVFAWVQHTTTVPNPVSAPKGIYELSLVDYSLVRLPIELPGASRAQQTGLLIAGGRFFAATGDGLWELAENEIGVWSLTSVLNEKLYVRTGELYTDQFRICLRSADRTTCIIIDVKDFSRVDIPLHQNERIIGIAVDAVFVGERNKSKFRAVNAFANEHAEPGSVREQTVLREKILQVLRYTSWGLSHFQTFESGRILIQVNEELPHARMWYIDPLTKESIFVERTIPDDLIILE